MKKDEETIKKETKGTKKSKTFLLSPVEQKAIEAARKHAELKDSTLLELQVLLKKNGFKLIVDPVSPVSKPGIIITEVQK